MYLLAVGLFFTVGILFAVTFRLELFSPGQQFFSNGVYNRLLTTHAVIMIFLFIIPGIPAIFGNFLLPIMIGANDVSFPRLNLMSWYLFMIGALIAVTSVIMGGPDTGWTFYVPYSALTEGRVVLPIIAVFILGWSSILTGLNFVTTVHRLRAPSMPWFKMPLFVWAIYATSWIQVIATPVVGITLLLVLMERFMGIGIFDPTKGGDPVLYQHLFWIYSHPAVYIMILPAMGVASEIIPVFCRKTIFGYKFIAASSIAIAAIGSLVWAHHMFTSGIADYARILFSLLTFLVAIPSAVKVFNWMATMYKGSIRMETPFILTVIFIILFAIGGFTGLTHGALSTDIHLHDTSYVVAHFHYTMLGGGGVMFFAALHYWFPLMSGKMYNKKVANLGVALFFIGFNMVYIPLFIAGMYGMPRRYATYLPEYTIWHRTSTIGSWFLASGLILMLVNILWAAKKGQKCAPNPWKGLTLEWTVPMPPPEFQFKDVPVVTHGPYEYATGASHE
ncbi:MAG: cbb3-type cytochrome c oxidase subunit I [Planctomycetia bacterium]|nr:cbb3-type cytochrome c oxidase subunit I [Planctomycetia bacterium]